MKDKYIWTTCGSKSSYNEKRKDTCKAKPCPFDSFVIANNFFLNKRRPKWERKISKRYSNFMKKKKISFRYRSQSFSGNLPKTINENLQLLVIDSSSFIHDPVHRFEQLQLHQSGDGLGAGTVIICKRDRTKFGY